MSSRQSAGNVSKNKPVHSMPTEGASKVESSVYRRKASAASSLSAKSVSGVESSVYRRKASAASSRQSIGEKRQRRRVKQKKYADWEHRQRAYLFFLESDSASSAESNPSIVCRLRAPAESTGKALTHFSEIRQGAVRQLKAYSFFLRSNAVSLSGKSGFIFSEIERCQSIGRRQSQTRP
jgi:hypothetical protein